MTGSTKKFFEFLTRAYFTTCYPPPPSRAQQPQGNMRLCPLLLVAAVTFVVSCDRVSAATDSNPRTVDHVGKIPSKRMLRTAQANKIDTIDDDISDFDLSNEERVPVLQVQGLYQFMFCT
ncbi:unnamed protein product [Phytophthora lilii]|uniref:RxLR effector protein n=1 Tax=Phytophthora lilii TaxID=2077276 RepID=A0A9W6TZQ2_9STRA|nr:unnamed protein product [Phytophthora lilii]